MGPNMKTREMELTEFRREVEGDRNIAHLMTATPFSSIARANYGSRLKPWLFKEWFYVDDGLRDTAARIRDVLDDDTKNLVLISGYQGCGKTVFARYLVDEFVNDGNLSARASSSFIDFETERDPSGYGDGGLASGGKFKSALISFIKRFVFALDYQGADERKKALVQRRDAFRGVFERARTIIEYKQGGYAFIRFAECYSDLSDIPSLDARTRLLDLASEMAMGDLLFAICLSRIAVEAIVRDSKFQWILVFDNLDDVIDERRISEFISEFVSFVKVDSSIFDGLRDIQLDGFDLSDSDFYRNFTFVFCVRDTNAAKFSAHVKDRNFYLPCDISKCIPRELVIERRLNFLHQCNLEKNARLKKQAEFYEKLLGDTYCFKRIYPLFNNNQRKAASVFQDVLLNGGDDSHSASFADEYHNLRAFGESLRRVDPEASSSVTFGAHGILLRLLIDTFRDKGYLKSIGGMDRNVSIPRIILTQLYNKCPMHNEQMVPDSSKMTLSEVWESLSKLEDIDRGAVAADIKEMHALFESDFWSHLLEIDTELELSASELEQEMVGESHPERRTGLYITCAGRIFVRVLSPHFEYFASRYVEGSSPLFSAENLKETGGRLRLSGLLDQVYSRVEECARHVAENDAMLAKAYFAEDLDRYYASQYLYRKPEGEEPIRARCQTHTERIVASHIGYIDAYRTFLLSLEDEGRGAEMLDGNSLGLLLENRDRIISELLMAIKRYICLLEDQKGFGHITELGLKLLREFKSAYLHVAGSEEGKLVSRFPIGRLARIRSQIDREYHGNYDVWYKQIDAVSL